MKFIYQNASRVLVWLGPARDDSDLGVDFIEEKAQDVMHPEAGKGIPAADLDKDSCHAVYSLLARPYWYRIWIVQEVSVASEDPVIGCGHKWLPWRTWGAGLFHIKQNIRQLRDKTLRGEKSDDYELLPWQYLVENYFDLDVIRRKVNIKASPGYPIQRAPQVRELNSFVDLLRTGKFKKATDQRDHIYALFGLLNESVATKLHDFGLVPDYMKAPGIVYREAFKFAVHVENDLEILELRNHPQCVGIPSWVPDFAVNSVRFPTLAPDRWHKWTAGGEFLYPHQPQILEELSELRVRGVSVDTIDTVVDLDGIDEAPSEFVQRVHRTALSTTGHNKSSRGCQYLEDATWRTLVGNRSAGNIFPCRQGYGVMYHNLVRRGTENSTSLSQSSHTTQNTAHFIQAMLAAVRYERHSPHRRFFTTRSGLLGLGTPDCQAADEVCIFRGYSMPVILRPREGFYVFLGSSYVHGIMRGEALPTHELGEEDREFVLR